MVIYLKRLNEFNWCYKHLWTLNIDWLLKMCALMSNLRFKFETRLSTEYRGLTLTAKTQTELWTQELTACFPLVKSACILPKTLIVFDTTFFFTGVNADISMNAFVTVTKERPTEQLCLHSAQSLMIKTNQ